MMELRDMNQDNHLDLIVGTGIETGVYLGDGLGGFTMSGRFFGTGLCQISYP